MMRNSLSLRLSLSLILYLVAGMAQAAVKYDPELVIEGTHGQKVVYDPAGTVLENETNLRCVVYVMRNFWWEAVDVAIRQVEGRWQGEFDVPEDATLICSKFVANGKTDWGWPATYASFVLDRKQQNKEGSRLGWAMLRAADSGLNLPGMMDDSTAVALPGDVQLMWLNNEFSQYPQAQARELRYLAQVLYQVKPGEKNQQLKDNIAFFLDDNFNGKLTLTDQELTDMYDVSLRQLNDSALAQRVLQREKQLFPDGIISRNEELLRIQNLFGSIKTRDADDPTSAQAHSDFAAFMKRFPSDRFWNAHSWTSDLFYQKIFRASIYDRIMRADDYSNLGRYIHDIPFDEMISTHWHVCEIPFINGQITAEKALPHSELIINEMLTRPRNTHQMLIVSPAEWQQHLTEKFQMALYAHARILEAVGRTDEAITFMERVFPYYGYTSEYADLYVKMLQKKGRHDEVMPYIRKCVPLDAVTQEMLDLLKADYLKQQHGGDFDAYLASLKNPDKQEAERAKAIAEMIDLPVELCELDKMGGGRVNLADKKGKILFIDFWATWCAPCKASMPGGQMTVDRWKDASDVEFYFVDTQEMKSDYRKKAEEFIRSKGFTFNVLYDDGALPNQDKLYKAVAGVLHTSGIPLKIIIDRRGHIRWMGNGYLGSPTQMADEISYIIEYLRAEQ